jgi:hypothetical protein
MDLFFLHVPTQELNRNHTEHHTNSRLVHALQNSITQSHDWPIPLRTTSHKVTIGPYLTEQHYTKSRLAHTLQNNITQTHDWSIPYRTALHKVTIGPYLTEQHHTNSRSVHTLQNNITQTHDRSIPYRTTLHKLRSVHTLQNNSTHTHDRSIPYRTTLHKLNIGSYLTVRHCVNLTTVHTKQNNIPTLTIVRCESSVQDRKATSIRIYYSSRATLKMGQQDPPKG